MIQETDLSFMHESRTPIGMEWLSPPGGMERRIEAYLWKGISARNIAQLEQVKYHQVLATMEKYRMAEIPAGTVAVRKLQPGIDPDAPERWIRRHHIQHWQWGTRKIIHENDAESCRKWMNSLPVEGDEWTTPEEAARLLHISRLAILKAINEREHGRSRSKLIGREGFNNQILVKRSSITQEASRRKERVTTRRGAFRPDSNDTLMSPAELAKLMEVKLYTIKSWFEDGLPCCPEPGKIHGANQLPWTSRERACSWMEQRIPLSHKEYQKATWIWRARQLGSVLPAHPQESEMLAEQRQRASNQSLKRTGKATKKKLSKERFSKLLAEGNSLNDIHRLTGRSRTAIAQDRVRWNLDTPPEGKSYLLDLIDAPRTYLLRKLYIEAGGTISRWGIRECGDTTILESCMKEINSYLAPEDIDDNWMRRDAAAKVLGMHADQLTSRLKEGSLTIQSRRCSNGTRYYWARDVEEMARREGVNGLPSRPPHGHLLLESLSNILGRSSSTLSQWRQQGMPVGQLKNTKYTADPRKVLIWLEKEIERRAGKYPLNPPRNKLLRKLGKTSSTNMKEIMLDTLQDKFNKRSATFRTRRVVKRIANDTYPKTRRANLRNPVFSREFSPLTLKGNLQIHNTLPAPQRPSEVNAPTIQSHNTTHTDIHQITSIHRMQVASSRKPAQPVDINRHYQARHIPLKSGKIIPPAMESLNMIENLLTQHRKQKSIGREEDAHFHVYLSHRNSMDSLNMDSLNMDSLNMDSLNMDSLNRLSGTNNWTNNWLPEHPVQIRHEIINFPELLFEHNWLTAVRSAHQTLSNWLVTHQWGRVSKRNTDTSMSDERQT